MFDEIKNILYDISKCCLKLYVSQNIEIKNEIRILKFTIVKRGVVYDNIVYQCIVKENDSKNNLKKIKKDLLEIKLKRRVADGIMDKKSR